MYKYSNKSREKLNSCHPNLQRLFNEVIKHYNCTILEGKRTDERQYELFHQGKSGLDGINKKSKHQITKEELLSMAIDVVPYPIPNNWGVIDLKNRNKIKYQARELAEFYYFSGFVRGIAKIMKIKIRCGADWDGDNDLNDQTFFDLPHFELMEK